MTTTRAASGEPTPIRAPEALAPLAQIRHILRVKRMRVHFVQALSDESGISRPMLSMILNGVATPGLDTLALLLAWDQQFEEPVWRYMNERGHQLRSISVATP